MRNALTIFMFALGLSALPLTVAAQEEEPEEETMAPVEEGDASETAVFGEDDRIPASDEAYENAEEGLNTANEARRQGREFGQSRAQEGRENAPDGVGVPDSAGGTPDSTPAP